ncbi:hypothetical protein [Dyadobacter sandarakinus]|uniref:hypothetical protein n=1 Tax=Dyadobacter sandarakinus TaxID=2747268 RepID=UPI001E49F591|nr:hypothetical protein [Dyadobacter sandarakinus]
MFIVILDATSLCELLKVPALIKHFVEHKSINREIGFIDFLSMHYWGKDIDDNDDEKDGRLPFKKVEVHHHTNQLFIPSLEHFTFKNSCVPLHRHYGPDKPQVAYYITLGSLFRPPRA